MVAFFVVYVVLSIATFIYLVHSASYFDSNKIYGWPMMAIILGCTIFVLFQRVMEVYSYVTILGKKRMSTAKVFSLIIDFALGICTLYFIVIVNALTTKRRNRLTMIDGSKPDIQMTMIIMVLGASWKLLEGMKLFKATRTMSQFFVFVMYDLRFYGIILLSFTILFSMMEFMNRNETSRQANHMDDWVSNFLDQYYVIFGDNPELGNLSLIQHLLYFLYTFAINIVNLNLLIAIIGIQLDDM